MSMEERCFAADHAANGYLHSLRPACRSPYRCRACMTVCNEAALLSYAAPLLSNRFDELKVNG